MTNHSMHLSRVFGALADPTRFAIIEHLAQHADSVSNLAKPFSMALPTFLQHLKVLESCGLIRSEKKGRTRICSLNAKQLEEVNNWLVSIHQKQWDLRLDSLEKYLEEGP